MPKLDRPLADRPTRAILAVLLAATMASAQPQMDLAIACAPTRLQVGGLTVLTLRATNTGEQPASVSLDALGLTLNRPGLSRDGRDWHRLPSSMPGLPSGRTRSLAPGESYELPTGLWLAPGADGVRRPVFIEPGIYLIRLRLDAEMFYQANYQLSNTLRVVVQAAPEEEKPALDTWLRADLPTYLYWSPAEMPGIPDPAAELLSRWPDSYYARLLRWQRLWPGGPAVPPSPRPLDDSELPPPPRSAHLTATFVQPDLTECGEVEIDLRLTNEGDQPWAYRTAPARPVVRMRTGCELLEGQLCDLSLAFSVDGRRWWRAPLFTNVPENSERPPSDPPVREEQLAAGAERSWRLRVLAAQPAFYDPAQQPAYAPGNPFIAGMPGPLHLRAVLRHKRPDGKYGFLESPVATAQVRPAPPEEAEALALWRKETTLNAFLRHPAQLAPYELRHVADLELTRRFPQSAYTAIIRRTWPERLLLAARPWGEGDTRLDRNIESAYAAPTPVADILAGMTRLGQVTLTAAPETAGAKLALVGPYKSIRAWMKLIAERVEGYWVAKDGDYELRPLPPVAK